MYALLNLFIADVIGIIIDCVPSMKYRLDPQRLGVQCILLLNYLLSFVTV